MAASPPPAKTENSTARPLRLMSTSVVLTSSQPSHVSSTGASVSHFSIEYNSTNSSVVNGSAILPTHIPGATGEEEGVSGGVIAVVLALVCVGVALVCLLVYLKVAGKLHRFSPCTVRATKRRSSTTSSRRPLDVDDGDDEGRRGEDDLPATREVTMFTIDDFEPVHDDEYSRTGGNNEEYYYDEVFGQSMFEDEVTNASMRHLYLVNEQDEDEDDMFDVEAIVSDVTTLPPPSPSASKPNNSPGGKT